MCDALRDLLPFVQLKKGEKHAWKRMNTHFNIAYLKIENILSIISSFQFVDNFEKCPFY